VRVAAGRGVQGRELRETSGYRKDYSMSLGLILLIVLILLLVGAFPRWGYSRSWGYGPTGGLGLVLIIVLILVLLGRI
jgi:hypothetical protein